MKKIVKFSKSNEDIYNIKKDFIHKNKEKLEIQIKKNKFYKKNSIRKVCKNCNKNTLKKFIKNFGIEYFLCRTCNHLNGKYQEDLNFSKG